MKSEAAARRRKDLSITGGVVAVVLALIVGAVWWQLSRNSGPIEPPANASGYGFSVGEDDAETEVEIFADYLCPACAQFEGATEQPLAAALEDGKVKVTHFPIVVLDRAGDYSERAANAVAVVLDKHGPEVALEFNRALFAQQPESGSALPGDDWLVDLAVQSGADESEVRDGIEDMAFERWVKEGTQEADRRRVRSTPTIFIDGEQVEFEAAVQRIAGL